MGRITLITGGCRSGKSAFAQSIGQSLPAPRAYIATCPAIDDEMRIRIDKHRQARSGQWDTIEQPLLLAQAIRTAGHYQVILVDCLTLWINNLMYHAGQDGSEVGEPEVAGLCGDVLAAGRAHRGAVIFVTNEVGMGIVPDNAPARRYRDLAGRCNQVIAAGADAVALVACGIPIFLKGAMQ